VYSENRNYTRAVNNQPSSSDHVIILVTDFIWWFGFAYGV